LHGSGAGSRRTEDRAGLRALEALGADRKTGLTQKDAVQRLALPRQQHGAWTDEARTQTGAGLGASGFPGRTGPRIRSVFKEEQWRHRAQDGIDLSAGVAGLARPLWGPTLGHLAIWLPLSVPGEIGLCLSVSRPPFGRRRV